MKKSCVFVLIIQIFFVSSLLPIRKGTKLVLEKIQKIEKILQKLESNISVISSEFTSIYKKISLIESKFNGFAKNYADQKQNKENIVISIQSLKEEITELKKSIGKINERLQSNMASVTQTDSTDLTQTDNIQSTSGLPDIYLLAYSDYINKNYDLAIKGFRRFIQLNPKTLRARKALYWIGECYYVQMKFKEAIDVFEEFLFKYKDGVNVADALLKKGFALIKLGRQTEGKEVLKKLISQYPFSEPASLAKQKIEEIKN